VLARAGASVALALVLANCAGPGGFSGGRLKNTNYSARVVNEGEPVPKGGGNYKLGNAYTINGKTYYPAHNPNLREEGIASWYGRDFHGRLTANGEVYDMNALSAAHPTMPLPSYARVTNLENGRSIVVRVNDRGPYARNRIIDLSIGTAKALNTHGKGLARVRVEYVGRAALAGSDDRRLMATLREGRPAPAPSEVRVASARAAFGDPPVPAERPFELGSTPSRPAPAVRTVRTEAITAARASPRSVVRTPAPTPAEAPSTPAETVSSGHGALGLMSGRGLY
jgi:rare lipoprotein A